MNGKNIALLSTRLQQLGFEPTVETMLKCHICFQPAAFGLIADRMVGADHFQFSVHAELVDKEYALLFYTATLRKNVIVPAELALIDQAVEKIDWNSVVAGKSVRGQINSESVQAAYDILEKMKVTGPAADILKYKYWAGTALEATVPQLAAFKAEWEISERFYFFDDTAMITFDDAVRFLNSRWLEKKMVAKKKLLVKKTIGAQGSGNVAGGKLLTKNPRRIVRRGRDKSSD